MTSNHSDAAARLAAIMAMPTIRPAQPTGSARSSPSCCEVVCPTIEAANSDATTRPTRAALWWCSTVPRKAGDTAVNSPSTAKPANPAIAARVNNPRTSGGTWSRRGRNDALVAGRHRLAHDEHDQ